MVTEDPVDLYRAADRVGSDPTRFTCLESIAMCLLVVALVGMTGVWALV